MEESEARLRSAADLAGLAPYEWNPRTGALLWDDSVKTMWSLPFESHPNIDTFLSGIHPDDRARVDAALSACCDPAGDGLFSEEYRVIGQQDRQQRWVASRGKTFFESGVAVQHVGVAQEITERKRMEEEHKRLLTREREARVLAEALRDTAAALNSTLDFDEVMERVLDNVGRVVPHDACTILLLEGDHWRVVRHRGFAERGLGEWIDELRIPESERPLYSRVAHADRPLLVPDTQDWQEWVAYQEVQWSRSFVSAPIRVKGSVVGLLNLLSATPDFFRDAHLAPLQALADQAGTALENVRLLEQVNNARARLQTLSEQLLVAQEDERRVIARELHDEIGQVLTAVSASLRAIEPSAQRAELSRRLQESLDMIDRAIEEVRDLSLDLRPSLLDDFGLVPALEWYLDRMAQRTELHAELLADNAEMRLPPGLETVYFRVAQIALTNVVRHAQAKNVRVELRKLESCLELVVRDDGIGFDVRAALERASHGGTLGLLSMQERVRLVHGTLEINSTLGRGTEVHMLFPLEGM